MAGGTLTVLLDWVISIWCHSSEADFYLLWPQATLRCYPETDRRAQWESPRWVRNRKEGEKYGRYLFRCWRTDAFKLWVWRTLLRGPRSATRSNQSILMEINPKYALEWLMLKLKLQYFGHLMWRADSLEQTLMLGKIEGRRERGQRRMRWLDGITESVDMFEQTGNSAGQGGLVCCSPWGRKEPDTT